MSDRELFRVAGVALVGGGVCIALFVLVLYPVGGFFGAGHAEHSLWVPAHGLHFIGALLTVFGLVGLYGYRRHALGAAGLAGFTLALAGTAQFVGTGMLTTFVWPVLAASAPGTLDPQGALFVSPANILFYTTALTLIPGYVLLAFTMWRANVFSRTACALVGIGVVLAITPPEPVGPVPWLGLVLGGVVFGIGEAWWGVQLAGSAA